MIKIYNLSQDGNQRMELEYELIRFPAGELHFKFHRLNNLSPINKILIEAKITRSDDVVLLCLMADYFKEEKMLNLLYTPYSRQDRITSSEEPFSLKTFCKLVNSCGFKQVTVYDPHSDVTPALIDNCKVLDRLSCLRISSKRNVAENVVVSPDAGAIKANNAIAAHYGIHHVTATKIRDTRTGEITGTALHTDIPLAGKRLLVCDDICDGGRTFIELAKVIRKQNPKELNLYVTHGIFSKGFGVVREYFDKVNYLNGGFGYED